MVYSSAVLVNDLRHVCEWHLAQQGLKVGEKAGTVHLVSPEGFPVEMDNYGERRATVVLFLSTRDEGTASEAEAIVALNHKHHEHHRVLFVGVFSEPGIERKGGSGVLPDARVQFSGLSRSRSSRLPGSSGRMSLRRCSCWTTKESYFIVVRSRESLAP